MKPSAASGEKKRKQSTKVEVAKDPPKKPLGVKKSSIETKKVTVPVKTVQEKMVTGKSNDNRKVVASAVVSRAKEAPPKTSSSTKSAETSKKTKNTKVVASAAKTSSDVKHKKAVDNRRNDDQVEKENKQRAEERDKELAALKKETAKYVDKLSEQKKISADLQILLNEERAAIARAKEEREKEKLEEQRLAKLSEEQSAVVSTLKAQVLEVEGRYKKKCDEVETSRKLTSSVKAENAQLRAKIIDLAKSKSNLRFCHSVIHSFQYNCLSVLVQI
jgi:chromosome segregation ATPase